MSNNPEPGSNPADNPEPGEPRVSRRPAETPAPEPSPAPAPAPPKPKVEVRTRKVPPSFYVGVAIATVGVALMLWASWRREP